MNAIKNETVKNYVVSFNNGIADLIASCLSVREMGQTVLESAIFAKAFDKDGEVGCGLLTEFTVKVGDTRAFSMQAIHDYLCFVFTPGAIMRDGKGNPIVDPTASAIKWSGKDQKWATQKHKVEVDGVKKMAAIEFDPKEVKRRVTAYKWYDFNAARPEAAYKGKAVNALKSDLKAMGDGKYIPEANIQKFLGEVAKLAMANGIEL